MTRSQEDVRALLERLGEGTPPELDAATERERRERIGGAVDDRLERLAVVRSGRRRRAVAAGLAAAFVAGAAAAWVVIRPMTWPNNPAIATLTSDRPVEVRHHGAVAMSTSARLDPSDEVHTQRDTMATAILANGASVELDPDSTVRFDARRGDTGQELRLGHGTVSLRVPKLGPHRTLSVVTPDARVTVRGTRFAVTFAGEGDRRETRVRVTEGSVWVDHAGKEDVLAAGQSWTSRPEPVPAAPAPPAANTVAPSDAANAGERAAPAKRRVTTETHATPRPEAPESTLAAENELYQSAAASIRAGQDARAVGLFDTFLARFRRSQLAQNAAAERLRALVRLGRHDAAVHAAKEYISAYPHGFAKEDAREVLAGSEAR